VLPLRSKAFVAVDLSRATQLQLELSLTWTQTDRQTDIQTDREPSQSELHRRSS